MIISKYIPDITIADIFCTRTIVLMQNIESDFVLNSENLQGFTISEF